MAEINTGINTNVGAHDQHNVDNRRSWTHTDFHIMEFHKGTFNTFMILLGVILLAAAAYWLCRRHQKKRTQRQQQPNVHYRGGVDPQAFLEMGLPPPPQGYLRPNHTYERPYDRPEGGSLEEAPSTGRRENFTTYRPNK